MERRCINLIKQELRRTSLPSCHRPWARPPAGILAPSQPSLSLPNPSSHITLGISFPGFDHVQPTTVFFPPAAATLRCPYRSLPGGDHRSPPRSHHRGPGDPPLLSWPLRAAAGRATSRHHRATTPAVAAAASSGLRRGRRHHPALVGVAVPAPHGPRRGRGLAVAAEAAAVVASTRRWAAAVPAAAVHHLRAGPYLGAGGSSSPAADRLLPHRDAAAAPAAAAAATNAAAAAVVLTDAVIAVRWAAATAAAAAAATDAVSAFRRCGSDLGPRLYIDTARDALPPGPFPFVAVTASGLDRYPPRVGGGEAAGCCARPPSASACAGDA
ncbi:uncharacterized protein [Lolium perenne]|uniref:uncharacterized protein n=1 Tax=Lolium perenne TaxID=4522 RepID=UPI0021F536E6|nr:Holliday junction resolvase MOC1, chloroplastic-like [Lolium perenne]